MGVGLGLRAPAAFLGFSATVGEGRLEETDGFKAKVAGLFNEGGSPLSEKQGSAIFDDDSTLLVSP